MSPLSNHAINKQGEHTKLTTLRRKMDEYGENLNKEVENVKQKYQTEVITELNNTLEGFHSRLDEVDVHMTQ